MGWVYSHFPPEGPKRYFERKLTHANGTVNQRVLRSAFFGRFEYYAALERTFHEDVYATIVRVNGAPVIPPRLVARRGDRQVLAVVIAVRYVMNDSHPFGYKSMSEHDGPLLQNCPRTILDLLSPIPAPEDPTAQTPANWALRWRSRCGENLERRKARRSEAATRAARTRAQRKAGRTASLATS